LRFSPRKFALHRSSHATDHFHFQSLQNICDRLSCSQEHQPGNSQGEIFALLGPNGAGKTTLIGVVCGIVNPSKGAVSIDGHDIIRDYRASRSLVGLVPQELTTDAFETVWNTVSFSRGLFGKRKNPAHIEKVLKELSLWDKKDD